MTTSRPPCLTWMSFPKMHRKINSRWLNPDRSTLRWITDSSLSVTMMPTIWFLFLFAVLSPPFRYEQKGVQRGNPPCKRPCVITHGELAIHSRVILWCVCGCCATHPLLTRPLCRASCYAMERLIGHTSGMWRFRQSYKSLRVRLAWTGGGSRCLLFPVRVPSHRQRPYEILRIDTSFYLYYRWNKRLYKERIFI